MTSRTADGKGSPPHLLATAPTPWSVQMVKSLGYGLESTFPILCAGRHSVVAPIWRLSHRIPGGMKRYVERRIAHEARSR